MLRAHRGRTHHYLICVSMTMKKARNQNTNEPSQRQLRVGEQLRHVIAETLRRGHFNHEILLNHADQITVSEVRASPDLKHARVYVSCLSEVDFENILNALNDEYRIFQRVIGDTLNLKFTPRVRFVADESVAHAQRIDELLRGIHIPTDEKDVEAEEE